MNFVLPISRHEIIRTAIRLLPDCIQLLFTHTYICVTFLIIYGTMWSLNMKFNVSFFAVVSSLLGYLELSVTDFGICIRNLVNYLTAEQRIKVTSSPVDSSIKESLFFQVFLLLNESKRDQRLISVSEKQIPQHWNHRDTAKNTRISNTCSIQCQITHARWLEVSMLSAAYLQISKKHADVSNLEWHIRVEEYPFCSTTW